MRGEGPAVPSAEVPGPVFSDDFKRAMQAPIPPEKIDRFKQLREKAKKAKERRGAPR